MKHKRVTAKLVSLFTFVFVTGLAGVVLGQEERATMQVDRPAFSKEQVEAAKRGTQAMAAQEPLLCRGPITRVTDIADENLRFTPANFFAMPGGGEGGGYDKTPILTTRVSLKSGCLNAHLSAIVGGRLYGVAGLTMFQVTLTPASGGPRHMVGHYEHPFGSNSPAVATEGERDVDMFSANFFQGVGNGAHQIPPGAYRVDVWWSGAGPGGAIGAAFVLKLYQ